MPMKEQAPSSAAPPQKSALPQDIAQRYALGLMPEPLRSWVSALNDIADSLMTTVHEVSDNTVVQAKIGWWLAEIERLFARNATHPATQLLQADAPFEKLVPAYFQQFLHGIQDMRMQTRYLDFPSLKHQATQIQGSLIQQTAALLGASATTHEAMQSLGVAMALKNSISRLGYRARLGRVEIPQDELTQFGVTISEIRQNKAPWGYSDRFSALIEFQRERALAQFKTALESIPAGEKPALRSLIVQARLDMAWLDMLPKMDYQILHQHIMLSPLKAWWVSVTAR